jgi:hypothetical protein
MRARVVHWHPREVVLVHKMSGCGGPTAQDMWAYYGTREPAGWCEACGTGEWVRWRRGARHAGTSGALASTGVMLVRKMSGCGGARHVGLLGRMRGVDEWVRWRPGARQVGASGALASTGGCTRALGARAWWCKTCGCEWRAGIHGSCACA